MHNKSTKERQIHISYPNLILQIILTEKKKRKKEKETQSHIYIYIKTKSNIHDT